MRVKCDHNRSLQALLPQDRGLSILNVRERISHQPQQLYGYQFMRGFEIGIVTCTKSVAAGKPHFIPSLLRFASFPLFHAKQLIFTIPFTTSRQALLLQSIPHEVEISIEHFNMNNTARKRDVSTLKLAIDFGTRYSSVT